MYALANQQKAQVEALLHSPPPELPPPIDAEADKELHSSAKSLFVTLGDEMAKREFDSRKHFDLTALAGGVPDELVDETTGNHTRAGAAAAAVHDLHRELNNWVPEKPDVRRVTVSADGSRVRAVVWHPQGRVVRKLRWTLHKTADGWRVTDWEDLRTGITGGDLVTARAASTGHRRSIYGNAFNDIREANTYWQSGQDEVSRRFFNQAAGAGVEPQLRYAIDLLYGRMMLGESRIALCDPPPTSQEVAEHLVQSTPERLAAYILLAEACLIEGRPQRAVEAANIFLSAAGDDADALALRGAARHALAGNGGDDLARALAIDPHQPHALDHRRKTADAAGKKAVADLLATAPEPEVLFDQLAGWAEADHDSAGVIALAERYATLRPNELRGVKRLVEAHPSAKQSEAAAAVMLRHARILSRGDLWKVMKAYERAHWKHPLLDVHRQLAAVHAPTAFSVLHERLTELPPTNAGDSPEYRAKREQAIVDVRAVFAAHRKTYPDDVWLVVLEGKTKNAEGKYADAAAVLAPLVRRLPEVGHWPSDGEGAFTAFRDELVLAWRMTGKAADAYRTFTPHRHVFQRLVHPWSRNPQSELSADDLEKLLDAQREVEGDTFDAPYWRAEVCRKRARYANAIDLYRKYIASDQKAHARQLSDFSNLERSAVAGLIRCLARSQGAKAADELATLQKSYRGDDAGSVTLGLVVLAYTGKPGAVALHLPPARNSGHSREYLLSLHADPDLGPILRDDPACAAFRSVFPPPAEQ